MTDPLRQALDRRGGGRAHLLLDGGLASELERAGLDIRSKLWSAAVLLQESEAIARVHRSYVEAGCDIITTASYQATYQGFAAHLGLDRQPVTELLQRSVALAKSACAGRDVLVAASVGPYGAHLHDGSE
jgi:homocysteine S-methyltransferase